MSILEVVTQFYDAFSCTAENFNIHLAPLQTQDYKHSTELSIARVVAEK
jgi:uncharacterized protein YlxP (DUF503 family)